MEAINWRGLLVVLAAVILVIRVENVFRKLQTDVEELRESVKQLARLTLSMDKRLWKLEGREPSGETTEKRFYESLGL